MHFESSFESPEAQNLLKTLKDGRIVEFKPVFSSKDGVVSYPEVEKLTALDARRSRDLLVFFAKNDILLEEPSKTFYSCPNCESKSLILRVACAFCQSESLRAGEAIEHHYCGYLDLADAFTSKEGFKCPKCGKPLKALGVDYRRIKNYYRCLSCGKLSGSPNLYLDCSDCQKRTPLDGARLDSFGVYRLNPEARELIERYTLDLSSVKELLDKNDFETIINPELMGKSGVRHGVALAAWRRGRSLEDKPDILAEVIISNGPVTEEQVSRFMIKSLDLESQSSIIVGVPAISSATTKLGSFYGIIGASSEKVADVPVKINSILEGQLPRLKEKTSDDEEVAPSPRLRKNLSKFRSASTSEQATVLLAMLYEKQDELQKTMKKFLDRVEENDSKVVDLVRRLTEEGTLKTG
ncbi:MAG: hypothetical protein OK422_00400 [Thaumarchaeota archaeon]|nr:hypothetical protein [Nitrososphaerota archaeon]